MYESYSILERRNSDKSEGLKLWRKELVRILVTSKRSQLVNVTWVQNTWTPGQYGRADGSVDISVDMTFPHLRRHELSWIWMCFIKQIKWNYQQTNTLNSVGSKVKWGKVVWVWFRESFGNRRARSRNVGSMKWYFLKQKKSRSLEIGSIWRTLLNITMATTIFFFRKKHSISESG